MKKLLFESFWMTLGLLLLVSILDLIFLTKYDFGIGFVFTGVYAAWGSYVWFKEKVNNAKK
jgi:hypothetical protein